MVEETLTRREKGHPAGCSGEEGGPELVLERADLATERRLRDPKALRGATDVPFLRDGNEVADLRETHGTSMVRAAPGRKSRRQIERVLDGVRSPAAWRKLR